MFRRQWRNFWTTQPQTIDELNTTVCVFIIYETKKACALPHLWYYIRSLIPPISKWKGKKQNNFCFGYYKESQSSSSAIIPHSSESCFALRVDPAFTGIFKEKNLYGKIKQRRIETRTKGQSILYAMLMVIYTRHIKAISCCWCIQ